MKSAITSKALNVEKKRFGRLSKGSRVTFIVQCIQKMKEENITAYKVVEKLRLAGETNIPGASTVYKWINKYNGSRKSLERKPWARKDVFKEQGERADNQWNYVLGHVSSKGMGLAQAHKDLQDACALFDWGKPLTIHQIYHRWEAIEPIYRDTYIMSHEEHYTKWAGYTNAIKCLPNERWQIDEFQFKLEPKYRKAEIIYGIACVDRASQICRHIELSLMPIEKVAFLRSMKRSLQANPKIGIISPAKPKFWQMDNARFHEPDNPDPKETKEREELTRDVHRAGESLDVTIYHNQKETPRQNCMVENYIGNFKRQLVPHFQYLIQEIAPPESCEEMLVHFENVRKKVISYCLQWNTEVRKLGESRIEFYLRLALPDSFQVTAERINQAVTYTVSRMYTQHGVQFDANNHYDCPSLIGKRGNEIDIRMQPEGPGNTVEAFIGDQHIGTLNRVEDSPEMHLKLNAIYKRIYEEQMEEQKALQLKFKDFDRQLELLRQADNPAMRQLILKKREIKTPSTRKAAKTQKRESLLAKSKDNPWIPSACRTDAETPQASVISASKPNFSWEKL